MGTIAAAGLLVPAPQAACRNRFVASPKSLASNAFLISRVIPLLSAFVMRAESYAAAMVCRTAAGGRMLSMLFHSDASSGFQRNASSARARMSIG